MRVLQGLKPEVDLIELIGSRPRGYPESSPDTKPFEIGGQMSFSAGCEAHVHFAAFSGG